MHAGALVTEWPAIIGSDACAVVLETGEGCTKLKKGDHVYSCMLIGQNRYSPFQDTYLVKEDLVFLKTPTLSIEQGCTVGAGLMVWPLRARSMLG